MEKKRQQELTKWLKQQSIIYRLWLNISCLFGIISGLLTIIQAWILAQILHFTIIKAIPREELLPSFIILALIFIIRSLVSWLRERINFYTGLLIRCKIRRLILDRLVEAGPAWIQGRPVGSWTTLIIEQVDNTHDYYARYLPLITLSSCVPILIVIAILQVNWMSAMILLLTAPLVPIFMTLIGSGAADANRRNFLALARLSGYFLDRLRGMETLRIFDRGEAEIKNIQTVSLDFRQRAMEVLRLAFLSSGVLEFFTAISIASVAAYFGFSYLGALDFGYYGTKVTLFAGFLVLILAPEFFLPLRDLGTFYHAKALAVGAADSLKTFLETPLANPKQGDVKLNSNESLTLIAENFSVLSPEGIVIAGPFNFTLSAGQRVVLIGTSGSGKSSLLNALAGFMAYTGSLTVNGIELRTIEPNIWRMQISWVSQNPLLPATTLRDNILLGRPNAHEDELLSALDRAWVNEFLPLLPNGIETVIGDLGTGVSVGLAQRIAIARALISPCNLLLLDEPTARLDAHSELRVMHALNTASLLQTTLMVTHHLEGFAEWDSIWVIENGRIVEQGDFATLTTAQGCFTNLLKNRKKEDIWRGI